MDELLADFLTETNESLAELDVALVRFEQSPDDAATLSQIFRLVHTIKGTCGFLGLPRLERVAHAAENVLGQIRDGRLVASPGAISLVLKALDQVRRIIDGLAATGAEPEGDDTAIIRALNHLAETGEADAASLASPIVIVTEQAGQAIDHPPATPVVTAPALVPGVDVEPPGGQPNGRSAIAAPVRADHVAEATPDHPGEPALGGQTIRVAVDVLESLMTLVGELVLTRNQLLQLVRTETDSSFTVPLQRLSQITSDLQDGVMKTRMQPIGHAWNKLPRLVRDLGRDLDKRLELVMHGQETELDRQVLELIRDPLTHMVRNSADHGIETPAERLAAGKPDVGHVRLNAYHEGGHVIITVADDGRGLSLDRIRDKAASRGLATPAELAAMSDVQVQRFIFHPGFSTAAQVTAVSGRGVGMDVVKTNIEKIGGTIDLRSRTGDGTMFTIKIPLTLAIVSALIVAAGGQRFAIPQMSVVELVHARASAAPPIGATERRADHGLAIERINDTPVLRLRERLLPLAYLDTLLHLDPPAAADAEPNATTGEQTDTSQRARNKTIVVVAVGAETVGLVVDKVFDTEEIVVKPVAPILRHITMFGGTTILGDGSVIMILDPTGLSRATGVGASATGRASVSGETALARDGAADRTTLLLFQAGDGTPKAVPLRLVARLENIARLAIERSGGALVTQYRGKLMPLLPLDPRAVAELGRPVAEGSSDAGSGDAIAETLPVIVFTDRVRSMGLIVERIIDVVDEVLAIQIGGARPGLLGTAVVAGAATEIIDTAHWVTQAWGDWFAPEPASTTVVRLLVVEDSDFFRQLLVPSLSACGYRITEAETGAAALALRDAGLMFDAVISDIAMPDMDGLAFARAVRAGGVWSRLPLIALSGRAEPADIQRGREAGFTDYVAKFDRNALLASLRQCLGAPTSPPDATAEPFVVCA